MFDEKNQSKKSRGTVPLITGIAIITYRYEWPGACWDRTTGVQQSHVGQPTIPNRVSSKQANFVFGSNRNKPKLNLFRLFFGLFCKTKKHFFRFVPVYFGDPDRYRNNQNKQHFLETNLKNLQKSFSIRGSSKQVIFFSVRTETNRNSICFCCFLVCIFAKPKNFFWICFGLFRCFGPVLKQPKQTELMVWGIKKVDILTNLLLFQLVFCMFWLF